jgi:catalase
VQVPAVRSRVIAQLRNVAPELAQAVAQGIGMTELPEPLPRVLNRTPEAEIERSPALSLLARPGEEGIKTRKVAILVAAGVDATTASHVHAVLAAQGAVARFVGIQLGRVRDADEMPLDVEVSMETAPAAVWDALVIPGGEGAVRALSASGHALEFLKDQYRHCKPIMLMGEARTLLAKANIPAKLPSGEEDPGLLLVEDDRADKAVTAFAQALAQHRHFARETDPPRV